MNDNTYNREEYDSWLERLDMGDTFKDWNISRPKVHFLSFTERRWDCMVGEAGQGYRRSMPWSMIQLLYFA